MADPAGLAIYIHWPWCLHKCPYCDFNSHASPPQEEVYVEAILQEMALWKPLLAPEPIVSLYFGGGTPSLMHPKSITQILEACAGLGPFSAKTEITVECNPTSTAPRFLADLRHIGVNRVSLGVQGLKEEWIAFLGRQHSAKEALLTLEVAQRLFPSVNADVIYGLPNQDLGEWTAQLATLAAMGLGHLSAYQLTVEPQTAFYGQVKRGLWRPIDEDTEASFFEATQDTLAAAGYENYEISNFAKPGHACRHNTHVWNYGSYLGLGAGAHGRPRLRTGQRLATAVIRQPEGYLQRLQTQTTPFAELHTLGESQTRQEALFLGLRLRKGIPLSRLGKTPQTPLDTAAFDVEEYEYALRHGLLEVKGDVLRLTSQGWPLLNALLQRLLRPEETLPEDVNSVHSLFPSVTF